MSNDTAQAIMADLVDELESFDPKYRDRFATLQAAVRAAGGYAVELYEMLLATPEGKALTKSKQTVIDWNKVNEKNRAQAQADLAMARSTGDF